MIYQTTNTLLNGEASRRQGLKRYLADLPILDRQVLDSRYGQNKCAASIAIEMGISQLHVERILTRAQAFVALRSTESPAGTGFVPARSQSPIAA